MTRRVGASVALFCGDKVLLVRRAKAPSAGLWSLPGGAAEDGETPLDAARRELAEETGIAVGELQFVEWFTPRDRYGRLGDFLLAVHAGTMAEQGGAPGSDVDALLWQPLDALGALPITSGTPAVIGRAHAALTKK